MSKIIIFGAATGSIDTPSMLANQPITAQAIAATDAGAGILHLHARNPAPRQPSSQVAHDVGFLPDIKAGMEAILNLATGGSAVMTLEQRLAGPPAAAPGMCSLNMSTMNVALDPMLGKCRAWHHDSAGLS
ncbi:MAG: 3-keto-5-aminohexanoate cleavage protein [Cypionkella sp.]